MSAMSTGADGAQRPQRQDTPADLPGQPPDDAVVDLLGALAYAELTACLRLAGDAGRAPGTGVRVSLARLATVDFGHYEVLAARLRELGCDPEAAMRPFVGAVDAFHDRTRPSDWLEGLVKAFVGDGIAQDFYREVATHLDPATRELVESVVQDTEQDEFIVQTVCDAIVVDPTVSGRLALWARRLVGEAVAQAQYVAVERDALAALIVGGGGGGADLAELGRMFTRLTEQHLTRMQRLGLNG